MNNTFENNMYKSSTTFLLASDSKDKTLVPQATPKVASL